jgi:NAD(P)-dependent dehydrogenase (short-subunit alcohol dehydrogenase family)
MATILVTGANRGIGLELATRYARRGDTVIATARDPATAHALTRLAAETGRVEILPLDVADEASIAALARSLESRTLDILVNNAGILGTRGGIEDTAHTMRLFTDVLVTNVVGPYLVTRAALPALKRARAGKIGIIASHLGSSAMAKGGMYPYRASKAGAINLAANLAVELKPMGIAVAAYHPGWVQTDMGGKEAETTVPDSAAGLIARLDHLTLATTGVFEDYRGTPYPY